MRSKEIILVFVVVISLFLIVAADIAPDNAWIGDDAEHKITTTELPKRIPSDNALISDDAEQEITTTELPKRISSDIASIGDDAEHEITTIDLPKRIFTCASPPEIEGSIPPQVDGNEHAIGTTVTYSCNYGYVGRNSINHISTCIENKATGRAEWTVPEIACIPRSCGDPGYVNNGRRIGNLFTFPNKVEFECLEGYKLVGMKTRYCQAGGEWSGRLPYCDPILCSDPPDLVNGEAIYSFLEYGSELTYKCYPGYMPTHKELRYCDEEGTWSGAAPECIETRCIQPIRPEYGEVHFSGEPKVGSIATFSCNPGLKLNGASTTKCLATGQWTFGSPKCLRSCSVPFVENGEIGKISVQQVSRWKTEEIFTPLSDGDHVDGDATLSFQCNKYFMIIEGDNILEDARIEVTCNDGNWSRDLHCKRTSCFGDPPKMENGKAMVGDNRHGHTIWYKCDNWKDTKLPGNVTCHFGTWIGITPQCLSITPCNSKELDFPGLVKPLQEIVPSSESVDITCKNGFRLSTSAKIITCRRGKWNITEDPCPLENTAPNRPTIVPPSQLNVEEKSTSSSSNRRNSRPQPPEQCNCTYNGAGYHVQANVGRRKLKDGEKVRKGKTVTFSCKGPRLLTWENGFRIHGNASMTCTTCQRWEIKDNPDCKILEYGGPFIMLDDSLEIQPGGVLEIPIKKPITLRCVSTHYYPQWLFRGQRIGADYQNTWQGGSASHFFSTIHISEIGHTNAGLYSCYVDSSNYNTKRTVVDVKVKENNCPLLTEDLFVSYTNGNKIGSTATFSCRDNSVLVGESQLLCQNDGTWSSAKPYCRAIVCTFFPTAQDRRVSYSDGNQVGSRAIFSCPTYATLVGSAISDCRSDGTWSSPEPFCSNKTTCELFTRMSGLKIQYSNENFPGSNAYFSCSSEKVLNGHSFAVCLENGTWSHTVPSCEDKCSIDLLSTSVKEGIVPDMNGVTDDLVPFGSTVPLKCEGKLIPEGNSTAVCGKEGRWKIEKFQCASGCLLNLKPSSHLQVEPLQNFYRFGENVRLSCPEGEKMSNDVELLMCLGYLTWSDTFPDCILS